MSKLPNGWRLSTVDQVGRVDLGRQRHPDWHNGPEMRPYLRVANVFEDRIDTSDLKEMDFSGCFERFRLKPGDVLLNEGQTPELLGRPAIYRGTPADVAFTNTLLRFKAGPDVLPEWALVVFRRHMHFGRFKRESRITTNIAHLSATRFKSVEFPVPPLDEQRRIVDILEDHFSRLDAAETGLRNADRRAVSLRTAAIAAELARFPGPERTIEQLSDSVRNGIFVSRPKAEPKGVPILRIGAVRPLALDLGDLRYSERDEVDLLKADSLLSPGDLLFTRYNGNPRYVGACAVVPDDAGPLTFPDKLIRVRIAVSEALPQYVAAACSVGRGRTQIQSYVKTTAGQAGISGRDIKRIALPIPSIPEQQAVVDAVSKVLDAVADLSMSVEVTAKKCGSLRRSLLTAAFSGRLTGRTQDMEMVEEMAGV